MRIVFTIIGDENETDAAANANRQFERIINPLGLHGNTEIKNHGKVSVCNGYYDSNKAASTKNPFEYTPEAEAAPNPKPSQKTRSSRKAHSR